jgi:hypothetical protein
MSKRCPVIDLQHRRFARRLGAVRLAIAGASVLHVSERRQRGIDAELGACPE